MFRVGTGLGQAMYCENLSDIDRLDLVSADVIRAGSLFLTMAGPFAGRIGGSRLLSHQFRSAASTPLKEKPLLKETQCSRRGEVSHNDYSAALRLKNLTMSYPGPSTLAKLRRRFAA